MNHLRSIALAASLAACVLCRLTGQTWSLDPAVAPVVVNDTSLLLNTTFGPAGGGQFLAYGDFTHVNGTPAPGLARLGVDGKLDPAFAPDLAADERVLAVAPLPDGRVVALLGAGVNIVIVTPPPVPVPLVTTVNPGDPTVTTPTGEGTSAGGVVIGPVGNSTKLIRLRADGRKDAAFTPLAVDGTPRLTPLTDGRVLVWGTFRSLGGQARNGLARLNSDGTHDATFAPALSSSAVNVAAVASASDGTLLVSAVAYETLGRATYFFVRLLATGAVDPRFAPGTVGTTYNLLAVQPDGSALAGNGNLTRYTPTGAVDRTYSAQIPLLKTISRLAPLPSGRLAVEATVGAANAIGAPAVFTLGANGQLERDFRKVPGAREGQRLLAAQPDGRVFVAQGTLVLNTSYYPMPFDTAAPTATTAIMPIFLGPVLAEPALAISPPDASAAPTTPLVPLATTITHRYAGSVTRLETDSAGRVLAAGSFTHIDGQPRAGLARFLASGALDPAFAPAAGDLLFAPPDGRPIVRRTTIGPFAEDGFHRYVTQVVRLQADGSVDAGFAFPTAFDAANTNWLAAAPDGRLLVAAFEPDANREQNLKLIWLGSDGRRGATLATTFSGFTRHIILPMDATGAAVPDDQVAIIYPGGYGLPNVLDAVQLLADGRLLVAGAFSRVNGVTRPGLVRLQSDGTLDTSYAPDLSGLNYPNIAILLPDGRALVFGSSVVNGRWQPRVLRLRADGAVDPAFQPPTDTIEAGACRLADGSFFSGGRRFFADGWPDLNFAPQLRLGTSNGYASTAALTADGRLWLGGGFDQVNGQPRSALARFAPVERVGITVSPRSQTVVAGRDAFFQVAIGTNQPATYRWTRDGATVPGATTAMLRLAGVRPDQAGVYRAIVTIGSQTFTSDAATLTVVPNTSRLVNFSARSVVAPNTPPQIAGLVCDSGVSRPVLLRAVGRGLPTTIGAAVLPVPVLTLYDSAGLVAQDRGGAVAPAVIALARSVGASPLNTTPAGPGAVYGSALVPTLGSGAFTALTSSGDAGAGVSLFEFYDTGAESAPPLIRNASIRGRTGPGAGVLIAGFVIAGNGPLQLLVRGIGPALSAFGVPNVVVDPSLAVYAAGWSSPFAANDDWGGDDALADAARRTGAFALPAASRDAALLLTLEPGAYTVQLQSADAAGGEALVEIYALDF